MGWSHQKQSDTPPLRSSTWTDIHLSTWGHTSTRLARRRCCRSDSSRSQTDMPHRPVIISITEKSIHKRVPTSLSNFSPGVLGANSARQKRSASSSGSPMPCTRGNQNRGCVSMRNAGKGGMWKRCWKTVAQRAQAQRQILLFCFSGRHARGARLRKKHSHNSHSMCEPAARVFTPPGTDQSPKSPRPQEQALLQEPSRHQDQMGSKSLPYCTLRNRPSCMRPACLRWESACRCCAISTMHSGKDSRTSWGTCAAVSASRFSFAASP